ncbi:neuroligin-4, Y-linked isoform X2 [Condylostylus longicornis]|uniref:neuroligin-4, Y-linked isoform X2 n=1 Tax=Condylostylus longicornis TaxID=2530218 RepID=UPI00244E3323|nr:neuroligin-4, Y-linked isoform X2 [Condylostylus longicornis]
MLIVRLYSPHLLVSIIFLLLCIDVGGGSSGGIGLNLNNGGNDNININNNNNNNNNGNININGNTYSSSVAYIPSSSSLSSGSLSSSSLLSSSSSTSSSSSSGLNSNSNNNNNNNKNNEQLPPTLSSRIVHTKYGAVSGVIVQLEGRHLDPVEAYKGIPYASPPIRKLRFMPPVTGAIWSGVKKADRFGPVCPQRLPDIANETAALARMPRGRLEYLKRLMPYLRNQSEDCLYLNIYAPIHVGSRDSSSNSNSNNHGQSNKFPVLVFVHGESYEWNSGNPYDGSVLASYGQILVVTVNYRLGILGFLNANSGRYTLPANYGLMDILAALHWLKENIAAFGGDPQSITLVGHGTGAACVHFLIASSAVPEGMLFNRAILMSGSGLAPWSLVENPAKYAAIAAHHVNCSPDLPLEHLMKCLREVSLEQLLSVPIRQPEFGYAFGPSIDGIVINGGEFLNGGGNLENSNHEYGHPGPRNSHRHYNKINFINSVFLKKSAINKLARYDLMAGVTRAEAFFSFNSEDVQYGIEADRRSKILKAYVKNTYSYHLNEIFATIVNEYTDWERPVQHPINIRDETLEALSDAQIVAPSAHTVELHSAEHRRSYMYVFDYQTKFGDFPQRQGCIHGEELPYLFGAPLVGGFSHFTRNYTKSEVSLSEIVMLYFSNFVRSGNPNEQITDGELNTRHERSRYKTIEWTPYESVHKKYLNFDTKPKLKNHYRAHRLSFWLNLIPELHKPGGDNVPPSHHQLEDEVIDNETTDNDPESINKLNPSIKGTGIGASLGNGGIGSGGNRPISNYTIFTTQVFSLFNLSSPSSALNPDQQTGNSNTNNGGNNNSSQEDGFAAYSTALSVTIAIGCSLLILNVLIFAGVYYQRDKSRLHESRNGHHGHHHSQHNTQQKKQRNENGQMPNNICGDLETLTIHSKGDPAAILGHHHSLQHHQMPPPEFADLPQRAPPPPKHLKSVPEGSILPPHALKMIGNPCNTLTKKSCMKQTSNNNSNCNQTTVMSNVVQTPGGGNTVNVGIVGCGGNQQTMMDELRV